MLIPKGELIPYEWRQRKNGWGAEGGRGREWEERRKWKLWLVCKILKQRERYHDFKRNCVRYPALTHLETINVHPKMLYKLSMALNTLFWNDAKNFRHTLVDFIDTCGFYLLSVSLLLVFFLPFFNAQTLPPRCSVCFYHHDELSKINLSGMSTVYLCPTVRTPLGQWEVCATNRQAVFVINREPPLVAN